MTVASRQLAKRCSVILVAILVSLLAAARAIEPEGGKAGSFVREVGGALTLGLLTLAVSRGAGGGKRACHAVRHGSFPATALGRECLGLGRDCGLTVLLVAPALVAGWEFGGTGSEFLSVATGALAASALGAALGFCLASCRVPFPAATLLTMSAASVLLWPATLGWWGSSRARFPAPEVRPSALLLVLALSVLTSGAALAVRLRRSR